MTADTSLSPELLHATSIFIVAISALQIAAFSSVGAIMARNAALTSRAKIGVPLVIAASLAAWFGWAALAVHEPVVAPEAPATGAGNFEFLIKMSIFFALGMAALFTSKSLRAIYAATPPIWFIGVQVYRVAGVMFLWPFLAAGALPATFALIAGIGDIATGITAVFVVRALALHHPRAYVSAVAWNYFGIVDFVVAVITAALSRSTNIGHFPLVIVQLFIVPLGILAHIFSLRNLAATRNSAPELNPAKLRAEAA